jgi:hypothetical protein
MKELELKKIAYNESGWETLFFHENTKSYWEKTHPNSEYHGGGNPTLKKIELTEKVKKKYRIK